MVVVVMEFRIDRRNGVPAFQQIVQQTKQALRLGVLLPGDQLPTAKDVAEVSAVNPNTTLKAYRELEREGLVEPRPGQGTFVRRTLARPRQAPTHRCTGSWWRGCPGRPRRAWSRRTWPHWSRRPWRSSTPPVRRRRPRQLGALVSNGMYAGEPALEAHGLGCATGGDGH